LAALAAESYESIAEYGPSNEQPSNNNIGDDVEGGNHAVDPLVA
jgi:hypothetical protein